MDGNFIYKNFSEEEVKNIYDTKIKKDGSYLNRKLIKCPVRSWRYKWNGHDAPRNFCIMDFLIWIEKYNLKNVDILNTTDGKDPELEFIKPGKINTFPYSYYSGGGNDLHKFHNQEKCDFFIINQTIEHLYNPFQCVKNIYNNLKEGGFVFASVPTITCPHDTPFHYTNWTPSGFAMLFMVCGFEIKEVGFWGNYQYISKAFSGNPCFPDIKMCGSGNQEKNAAGTWLLAKKV